ncbi:MAG: hypothetical protein JW963_03135 [Anaerolineales bacterium]|nr:hypothetical protein [Anaerolineales bacterium]
MQRSLSVLLFGLSVIACSIFSPSLSKEVEVSPEDIAEEETKQAALTPTPEATKVDQPNEEEPTPDMIFAVFEGEADYESNTTHCTCDDCEGTVFIAQVNIGNNGGVSGVLFDQEYPDISIPLTGNIASISGEREAGPNNCGAYSTQVLEAQIVDGRTFVGTFTTSYTPGNCRMDNCGGTYTFSLERK